MFYKNHRDYHLGNYRDIRYYHDKLNKNIDHTVSIVFEYFWSWRLRTL
jgi:hypothetical protein